MISHQKSKLTRWLKYYLHTEISQNITAYTSLFNLNRFRLKNHHQDILCDKNIEEGFSVKKRFRFLVNILMMVFNRNRFILNKV